MEGDALLHNGQPHFLLGMGFFIRLGQEIKIKY
jgi:hypothetical protein